MTRQEARDVAMRVAWSYLGTWYRWGGDDPSGFDCSGLAVEVLKSVNLLGRDEDRSAANLCDYFKTEAVSIGEVKPGALVFFADAKEPAKITHVEIAVNGDLSLGASGGGSKTLTVEDAIRQNAYVKVRPIARFGKLAVLRDPFLLFREV
jgi:cell wall-associated NlpC family hydrolase